jgi:diguanylate cyclase (GGDEF)-like protein
VSAFGERGLLTRHGVARVVALLVPLPLVWWLAQPPQEALASLLRAPVLSLQPPAWTSLTAAGCTAYAVATAVLVARLVVHRSPVDAGLIGALAGSALGLDAAARVPDSTAYLTAGATALVVALVQESHRLAYLDELTRLPGRRALDEEMAKLGGRYAVAMLDVDHFKSFNDTYGHDVGDQILRLVASRIASGEGRAFRYGGEEFTVLFPGCSAREALPHLERVRAAVEAARMTLRGPDRPVRKPRRQRSGAEAARHREVSVTISIGVADRTDERRTPEEVREAADRALYRAKEQGRNQVNLAAAGPARRRSGSR